MDLMGSGILVLLAAIYFAYLNWQGKQEKDKLLDIQTMPSKNNDPTCKISEIGGKRIQDLENQLSDLREKVSEQSRALKDSQQTEEELAEEISEQLDVMIRKMEVASMKATRLQELIDRQGSKSKEA